MNLTTDKSVMVFCGATGKAEASLLGLYGTARYETGSRYQHYDDGYLARN